MSHLMCMLQCTMYTLTQYTERTKNLPSSVQQFVCNQKSHQNLSSFESRSPWVLQEQVLSKPSDLCECQTSVCVCVCVCVSILDTSKRCIGSGACTCKWYLYLYMHTVKKNLCTCINSHTVLYCTCTMVAYTSFDNYRKLTSLTSSVHAQRNHVCKSQYKKSHMAPNLIFVVFVILIV